MTLSSRASLARLLSPVTVAVVGANEKLGMSNNAVLPMLEAGRAVHLVNPNRDELYGQKALPSLSALGEPVDAVLSLVNAERTIGVLEQAAVARRSLVDLVVALDALWRRHGSWLASVDVNPLIVTDTGVVAVDALSVAG